MSKNYTRIPGTQSPSATNQTILPNPWQWDVAFWTLVVSASLRTLFTDLLRILLSHLLCFFGWQPLHLSINFGLPRS